MAIKMGAVVAKAKKLVYISIIVILVLIGVYALLNFNNGEKINSTTIPSTAEFSGEIKEFNITANNWKFTPQTITVNQGDKVILNIKSIDATHGISLNNFGISEQLNPGEEKTIEFIANKKGEFSFFCNVYCGQGHSEMKGMLVVE